jgi:hypothetical protein
MKPNVTIRVEHLYHFKTSKAPESIRFNVEHAKMLLRDMNFIYAVSPVSVPPRLMDIDTISPIGGPGWRDTSQSIQPSDHPRGY